MPSLGERFDNLLLSRVSRAIGAVILPGLGAATSIVYNSSGQNLKWAAGYLATIILIAIVVRYLSYRAEQRRIRAVEQKGWFRRLSYEHSAEVLSSTLLEQFSEVEQFPQLASSEKHVSRDKHLDEVLEDLTTRVFEADARESKASSDVWAGNSFKATVMVKERFTKDRLQKITDWIQSDRAMKDEQKQVEIQKYSNHLDKFCLFVRYWYYPGGSHPESDGIPYIFNDGVAGFAWFNKCLVIWTKEGSCTPRLLVDWDIFAEKYRGQMDKYRSMVCVPIEHLSKEKKTSASSESEDDGVLGVLTITCERESYFLCDINYAKYLQTLLAPYVVLLSHLLGMGEASKEAKT